MLEGLQSQDSTPLALVVLCTCPDDTVADTIARQLVTRRLAACVNQLGAVRSTYYWQGELQQDQEVLLLIKTTVDGRTALEDCLRALHPYENPEIIALPVVAGADRYLQWLVAGCQPPP